MSWLIRYRVLLLTGGAAVVLLLSAFWPEEKKQGEVQKYYKHNSEKLLSLSYEGAMSFGEKEKVDVSYQISPAVPPLKFRENLFQIELKRLTSPEKKLRVELEKISRAKIFFASGLVQTMVNDWAQLDFYFVIPYEATREKEYGLENCANRIQILFKNDDREFCVGTASHGDTRRYLLDRKKNQIVIVPDYVVRRMTNNILAQRNETLQPYISDAINQIEVKLSESAMRNLPTIKAKTKGVFKLKMLVKRDEAKPSRVWFVEDLMGVRPSHAAEFAQLLTALRISRLFALPAQSTQASLDHLQSQVGLTSKDAPTLSGTIGIQQTDRQDTVLTRYALFAPGVRPSLQPAFQKDGPALRPHDSLVISSQNAGYLSADLYPRFEAILLKFEVDLKAPAK